MADARDVSTQRADIRESGVAPVAAPGGSTGQPGLNGAGNSAGNGAGERKAFEFINPWAAVIVVVVVFLAATVIAQVLVSVYPALHHWSDARANSWLGRSLWAQFIYTLIAYALLLAGIVGVLRLRKIPLRAIGIKRPRWRDLGYALGALPLYYLAYIILVVVVSHIVPELNVNQQQQIGFGGAHGFGPLALTFLSLVVIPPIVEEITMRGFLFTNLRAKAGLVTAVIITSVLFAIGHLQFGSGAPLLWIAAIDTFTLSLFLIYVRVKTDSLWASICLHALKNLVAFVSLFIFHLS
ncbi:MAG TPA: type II CAAX endopeptidase family protein [Candidatus Saccharimonadales bacterium]